MSDDHHGRLSRQGPAILGLVALLALLRWTLGFPPSEPQKPDQKTKAASPSQPHVSLANFRRIKRGMSVAQVEAIFGTPGEDGPGGEGERPYSWREGPNVVEASFRIDDGKATCAYFFSYSEKNSTGCQGMSSRPPRVTE